MSSCDHEIVLESKRDRLGDIETLWNLYQEDPKAHDSDLGRLDEYGLCFDYVEPHTFSGQQEGYRRWQLSWGGPQEEFRIFMCEDKLTIHNIEFWYLDWFCGTGIKLYGADRQLLEEILVGFFGIGG